MLHPSYAELIQALNSDVVEGEPPVVNSRYSVVLATAKRARQLAMQEDAITDKHVSCAIKEISEGLVKIKAD